MMKDRHSDLSELLHHLRGVKCVIDPINGVFIARLPTEAEKYRLMLHHNFEVTNHNIFANGTENLTVKQRDIKPLFEGVSTIAPETQIRRVR